MIWSRQLTVKINFPDLLELVKKTVVFEGIDGLPEDIIFPKRCPICNEKLTVVENVKLTYLCCENCGYTQRAFSECFNVNNASVLELALVSLLYLLKKKGGMKNASV